MNMPAMNQIQETIQQVGNELGNALDWVSTSSDPNIAQNNRLKKGLRTGISQLKKLNASFGARLSVGVYGPSQSGKSYLVSALAKQANERLTVMIADSELDFIESINPAGGQEATGLVTRFTTKELSAPRGFPIAVTILKPIDIVKILVNSYALDLNHEDEVDLERIKAVLARIESEAGTTRRHETAISVEEIYELEEYCTSRFASSAYLMALKNYGYWEKMAELMPFLNSTLSLNYISTLWEDIKPYTDLYIELTTEIARLGLGGKIYCTHEALFTSDNGTLRRSERSIINVQALKGYSDSSDSMISVTSDGSNVHRISRSLLCALCSEIVFTVKQGPNDLLNVSDLLDFPGARSRKGHPKDPRTLDSTDVKIANFLRGKVGYLFDKYSNDLDLTALALCLGPSNQEVVGLDNTVEDWIVNSHGETPEMRERIPPSLFIVLTKFDQEFSEGSGKPLDESRWATRLQASLLNSFGVHSHRTNWVRKWSPTSAFNNLFWLRNPSADQSGLVLYEGTPGESPEIGFSPAKQEAITRLQNAFVSSELVRQHFVDPYESWQAAMKLNDGGASYLIEKLAGVCKADLKTSQIINRLNYIVKAKSAELSKYHITTDLSEVQRRKSELSQKLLKNFIIQLKLHRLGEFIFTLLQSELSTIETYKRTSEDLERTKSARPNTADQSSNLINSRDRSLYAEFGLEVPAIEDDQPMRKNSGKELVTSSFGAIFIKRFLEDWRTNCLAKFSNESNREYLIFDRELLGEMLDEIEQAFYRECIYDKLVNYVDDSYQFKADDRRAWIWRQTAVVTSTFNNFIANGCTQGGPLAVEMPNGTRGVILQPPVEPVIGEVSLGERSINFSEKYLKDWVFALRHAIHANAAYQAGVAGNLEEHVRLGAILERLKSHHIPEEIFNAGH